MLYIPRFHPISPTFGTKPLPCRRFLHHYYRDTFIESHRKPRDVPQMCYSGRLICSMLALIPQSRDFSGAALGVRSIALLQVAKIAVRLFPKMKKWLFIQITPINHHFTNQNLHICDIFCTFAADLNLFYFLKKLNWQSWKFGTEFV